MEMASVNEQNINAFANAITYLSKKKFIPIVVDYEGPTPNLDFVDTHKPKPHRKFVI